jgi:hypothetical protein
MTLFLCCTGSASSHHVPAHCWTKYGGLKIKNSLHCSWSFRVCSNKKISHVELCLEFGKSWSSIQNVTITALCRTSNYCQIYITYQQHWHSQINLFCLLSLSNEVLNNSSDNKKVFTLQKKIVRITVGAKPQNCCRGLFKRLVILPLPCEHKFSLMNFIINNQEHFQANSAVHGVNTRNKHHLHIPIANLRHFHKNAHYTGIKIVNNPYLVWSLTNENAQFKVPLK